MKFVDSIKISLKAGNGGSGYISFFQDWMQKNLRPDGGNGGNGGNIILVANANLNSLFTLHNVSKFVASNGEDGARRQKNGKSGDDLYLQVPVGTVVFNSDKTELIFDFTFANQKFVVAHGGKGGLGNAALSSRSRTFAKNRNLGTLGEHKNVYLDLRFVADIGLIGFPNVGKSSLLNAITNAVVKIGDYPFTTLIPNLGVLEFDQQSRITIADLPGIIEDAHKNKGLGNQFLKHAKRCRLLVHLVDLSSSPQLIKKNITLINNELFQYNSHFRSVPQIVVGNKLDLVAKGQNDDLLHYDQFVSLKVSALLGTNLEELKQLFFNQILNSFTRQTVAERELQTIRKSFQLFSYPLEKNLAFRKIGSNT